jgi:hypothetical protein
MQLCQLTKSLGVVCHFDLGTMDIAESNHAAGLGDSGNFLISLPWNLEQGTPNAMPKIVVSQQVTGRMTGSPVLKCPDSHNALADMSAWLDVLHGMTTGAYLCICAETPFVSSPSTLGVHHFGICAVTGALTP